MKKSLKVSTVVACAISTSLILGGCGDKNKSKSANLALAEKIDIRKVDNAEAEKALSALGFSKSDNSMLTWSDRDGSNGSYTFKNLSLRKNDEGDLNISQLKLLGVHMQDDQPAFDKIVIEGFNASEKSDKASGGANVKVGKITVVKPSKALSAGFARMLNGVDDPFEDIKGKISFQSASFSDLNLTDDDTSLKINLASLGEAKDKTGMFVIKGLDFNEKGNENTYMKLGSLEITGIDSEKFKNLMAIANGGDELGEEAIKNMFNSSNMFNPGFKHMSLKGFDGNFDGLFVNLDSYVANADKKGSKIVMSQKMSPLTIKPGENSKNAKAREFAKAINDLGYEKLEFTFGGKSIIDEANDTMKSDDTWLEMTDGFRLSYGFDFSGYKELSDKMAEMYTKGGNQNPMQSLEMMSALKVNNLRLAFKDDSIIDRGFKMVAKQKGGDAAMLKNQAKAGLAFLGMMAKDEAQQKLAGEIGEAVGKLLDNGGTIIFEMNPAAPFSFDKFIGSKEPDIAAMGLKVYHQE